MTKQTSPKHRNILFASVIVVLTATIFLVLGPITELGAADKATAMVESADGSAIAYDIQGHDHGEKSPTLVFIHGWTCDRGFWKPQIEHFSKTYRVISLDLAGHGLSGSKRDDYTMAAFGQDVAAVVRKAGVEQVVLIGHSMGGPVAVEAADLLKARVAGIIAVDVFVPLGLPESEEQMAEFMMPFEDDFKTASEAFVRAMFLQQADPNLVDSIAKAMSSANKNMAVSALRNTIEWLIEDLPSLPERYPSRLRNIDAIYDGQTTHMENVITIPDVGHFIPQVKPDAFNEAVENILSEYRDSHFQEY
uniref:Pimeloyl-ACP methyl ester carboxylesterase n=1 Tax=Candidatus Kentrum sp. DK TaxID=2126562 RepID=A0A450SM19_9GAMM|nr:MAG: Pimeloyl-ACP methyl ester carboxylesterase [Candidatus Kentron sp. DK]